MKNLSRYDEQRLDLLERFFWSAQAVVYKAQAAAVASDMDFEVEFAAAICRIKQAAEQLAQDNDDLLAEQAEEEG